MRWLCSVRQKSSLPCHLLTQSFFGFSQQHNLKSLQKDSAPYCFPWGGLEEQRPLKHICFHTGLGHTVGLQVNLILPHSGITNLVAGVMFLIVCHT